jgi:hypothetical protein
MGGTKLQNSNLKEENMESMKANYKIPTLMRRTWKHESKLQTLKRRTLKHESKLQNSNLKEENMEA